MFESIIFKDRPFTNMLFNAAVLTESERESSTSIVMSLSDFKLFYDELPQNQKDHGERYGFTFLGMRILIDNLKDDYILFTSGAVSFYCFASGCAVETNYDELCYTDFGLNSLSKKTYTDFIPDGSDMLL